jgi:hypothetical protein
MAGQSSSRPPAGLRDSSPYSADGTADSQRHSVNLPENPARRCSTATDCTAGSKSVSDDIMQPTRRPMPDADLAVSCLDRSDEPPDQWPTGSSAAKIMATSDKVHNVVGN